MKYKLLKLLSNNKLVLKNFSYITILQIFVLLSPLLTYPYLVKTLGKELYGWVITSQIIASYCSVIIDFGFKRVSARHIALNRTNKDKMSEIVSSIIVVQIILSLICAAIYFSIIFFIQDYRVHLLLFIFSFGLIFNELLFPYYYYQGIEQMKFISVINIVIRSVFILLIFVFVKVPSDYYYVPVLQAVGMIMGGVLSLYIMFFKHKLKFHIPSISVLKYYTKDAAPIFFTDIICTIKDKLNYILLGSIVGISNVVVYDISAKLSNLCLQPIQIFNTVIFPRMTVKYDDKLFKYLGVSLFACILFIVLTLNIFLESIIGWFIIEQIDLMPVRIYLLSPIFLCISSYLSGNLFVARGYNRILLYSIVFTTAIYLVLLLAMLFTGHLTTVTSFVFLTVVSYFGEMVYRLFMARKVLKETMIYK